MSTHYVGRITGSGDRVYVTIELRRERGTYTGSDHEPITDPLSLSITGDLVGKGRRTIHASGQISVEADQIATDGSWSAVDVASLWRIWREWHLNGLNAACDHMDLAGLPTDYESRRHVTCPITGERYGWRWRWRALPADVVAEVRRLQALPTGRIPEYVR